MNSHIRVRRAGTPPEWTAHPVQVAEREPAQPGEGELRALENTFQMVFAAQNAADMADTALQLAQAHLARREPEAALQYLVMAAEACERDGDQIGLRRALLCMAEGLASLRHFRQSTAIYERLWALETGAGIPRPGSRVAAGLANCLLAQRRYEEVVAMLVDLGQADGDWVADLSLWRALALAQLALGQHAEAADAATQLVRLAAVRQAPDALAEAVTIAGHAANQLGRLDVAMALLEQGLSLAEKLALDHVALMATWHISDNLARRADMSGALKWYRRYVERKSALDWAKNRTIGQALGSQQLAARSARGLGRRVLRRRRLLQRSEAGWALGQAKR